MAEASALTQEQPAITPAETVMIGDSDVDVLTARNCGARAIGCLYGLAPHSLAAAEPDALAESPLEWTQALRTLGAPATAHGPAIPGCE
jgi:phosphoglycolate phosphatase